MKRRRFIGAVAAGAAIAAWPAWLQKAFGQDRPGDEAIRDPLGALSAAFRRAQRAGKPLLVLVVPAADEQKWQRGQAFGELINHGGDEVMVSLALAEVVCAPMSAVRRLAPQTPARPAEPLMVVIETSGVPARVELLHATLAADPPHPFGSPRDDSEGPIDARIAALSRLLQRSLRADARMIERRAAQARARLGPGGIAELDRALAAHRVAPALADRGAAYVLASELLRSNPVRAWRQAIAQGAIARVRARRIEGSHWANSHGCGTDYEDTPPDERRMIGCGMGFVPPRSARFLSFFTLDRGL